MRQPLRHSVEAVAWIAALAIAFDLGVLWAIVIDRYLWAFW